MFNTKTAILSGVITTAILVIAGCTKTTTVVKNAGSEITATMSFSKDIVPIFDKSCAVSGCHVSGGKAPDLTSANAFKSLSSGNYFKAGDPENSNLMMWLNGKKSPVMPMGGTPNTDNNAKIYAWINQGAKNN